MSKELIFVQACPDTSCFWWQTAVQLHNLRKFGYSKDYHALIFLPADRDKDGFNGKWKFLERKFPEAHFHYYRDEINLINTAIMINYIPLLRPYCLKKFCEEMGDMSKFAMFYFDSDVILQKELWLTDKMIDDDINYLSYTGRKEDNYNYICADHFLNKQRGVLPEKLEQYQEKDILGKLLSWFNLTEDFFIKNKDNTGGAQYLLKNVSPQFFQDVYDGCIVIRTFLSMSNQEFMKGETKEDRENNGVQSWCADMWSVLFNLWKNGKQTICPDEMNFSWATDKIERWDKCTLYHDSGGTSKPVIVDGVEHRLFNKRGERVNGKDVYQHSWDHEELRTPFQDDLSFVSKEFCSYKYVKEIEETKKFLIG